MTPAPRRFRGAWRWVVALAVTALVCSLPTVIGALPVAQNSISAATLLARIQTSGSVAYSGYAESAGALNLPDAGQFGPEENLFSGITQLRAWYRGTSDWRVDTIAAFGESDVHASAAGLWTWDYESNEAVLDTGPQDVAARLPRAADLLPGDVARRVLSGATPATVTRIADERIAGRDAVGLRLRPAEPQSTVDRVDVWALPGTGLPLRVTIYAKGASASVLSTSLLDVSVGSPPESVVAFTPAAGTRVRTEPQPDIVSAVDQLGRGFVPPQLAGLPRQATSVGAVGVYGHGVTTLIAIPLPSRTADSLRAQLGKVVGIGADGSVSVGVPGLNLRLSPASHRGHSWLLVGTVTAATLATAASQLPGPGGFR